MKIPLREKICYGIGNYGYSVVSQTISGFIMFFGTSVLGLRGVLVGIAVFIGVLWDSLSDPLVGYLSDRQSSANHFGKRHLWMLIGTLGMSVTAILVWSIPPSLPVWLKFTWIVLSLLAIQTFCTMFSTPHLALGFDMTSDPHEQTTLQGIRTVFFLLGMLTPSILMYFFMPSDRDGMAVSMSYTNMSYVISVLCLLTGLCSFFGTWSRKPPGKITKSVKSPKTAFSKVIVSDFSFLFRNKQTRNLLIGYSVSLISSSLISSVGMHIFTYAFHFNSSQIAVLMASLILSAILSQPFWNHVAKKGKMKALIKGISTGLFAILLIGFVFLLRDLFATKLLFGICIPLIFVIGFGTGALYSLPYSIFSDIVNEGRNDYETDKTATFSGIMTLSSKIAGAFSLLLIGIFLDIIKFNEASPVQPLSVQNGLGVLVIIGSALSLSLSINIYKKGDKK